MRLLKPLTVSLLLASFTLSAQAAGEGWISDWKKAQEQASNQSKDLLVDFTGSDWCGWCVKLTEEVFSKEAFIKSQQPHFVFVELDYPRDVEQSEELKKQNSQLSTRYQVRGFPTIMLADAKGRPYAITGYESGGPDAYNKHLDALRNIRVERDKAFAAANKLEGAEKAKALDAALEAMKKTDDQESNGVSFLVLASTYPEVVSAIIKEDSEGKLGLKPKYEKAEAELSYRSALSEARKLAKQDPEKALAQLLGLARDEKIEPELRQVAYYHASSVQFGTQKNYKAAIETLREGLALAPESKMAKRNMKRAISMVERRIEQEEKAKAEAAEANPSDTPEKSVAPESSEEAEVKSISWVTNWEAAQKQAVSEKKDLLIDFTGSDWCSWCVKLEKEVFETSAFAKKHGADFVFVKLDFPQNVKQPDDLIVQNQTLMAKYGVKGFPTILLADAKGRPYAWTGYESGGPEKYSKHVTELREIRVKRDADLAAAEKLEGIDRAKALDAVLTMLRESEENPHGLPVAVVIEAYNKIALEIIELDKENEAGLKSKYEKMIKDWKMSQVDQKYTQILRKMMQGAKNAEEAEKKMSEFAEDESNPLVARQRAKMFLQMISMRNATDMTSLKEGLVEVKKMMPDSPVAKEIDEMLEGLMQFEAQQQ